MVEHAAIDAAGTVARDRRPASYDAVPVLGAACSSSDAIRNPRSILVLQRLVGNAAVCGAVAGVNVQRQRHPGPRPTAGLHGLTPYLNNYRPNPAQIWPLARGHAGSLAHLMDAVPPGRRTGSDGRTPHPADFGRVPGGRVSIRLINARGENPGDTAPLAADPSSIVTSVYTHLEADDLRAVLDLPHQMGISDFHGINIGLEQRLDQFLAMTLVHELVHIEQLLGRASGVNAVPPSIPAVSQHELTHAVIGGPAAVQARRLIANALAMLNSVPPGTTGVDQARIRYLGTQGQELINHMLTELTAWVLSRGQFNLDGGPAQFAMTYGSWFPQNVRRAVHPPIPANSAPWSGFPINGPSGTEEHRNALQAMATAALQAVHRTAVPRL